MLNEVKEKNKEDVFEINEDENVINTNNNVIFCYFFHNKINFK